MYRNYFGFSSRFTFRCAYSFSSYLKTYNVLGWNRIKAREDLNLTVCFDFIQGGLVFCNQWLQALV